MYARRDALRVCGLLVAIFLATAAMAGAAYPLQTSTETLLTEPPASIRTEFEHQIAGGNWQPPPHRAVVATGGIDRSHAHPVRISRALIWGGTNAVGGVAAFRQSQRSWGKSTGKFHFKHDWKGDGMALSDEVSHMFAAYRLQQVLHAGYRWTGIAETSARRLATLEAWLWTFAVEFPIDAFNPTQGFGVSDVLFNTTGVLAAHLRSTQQAARWDIKISVKRSFLEGESRIIAQDNEQYDDYIYWWTYRPSNHRYLPILLGLGYSTHHESGGHPGKQLHFGLGTSLDMVAGIVSKPLARALQPLNFFYFNLNGKIVWR